MTTDIRAHTYQHYLTVVVEEGKTEIYCSTCDLFLTDLDKVAEICVGAIFPIRRKDQ